MCDTVFADTCFLLLGLTTDEVELALSQAGATEAVQTPVQIAPGALVPVPPPPGTILEY